MLIVNFSVVEISFSEYFDLFESFFCIKYSAKITIIQGDTSDTTRQMLERIMNIVTRGSAVTVATFWSVGTSALVVVSSGVV